MQTTELNFIHSCYFRPHPEYDKNRCLHENNMTPALYDHISAAAANFMRHYSAL